MTRLRDWMVISLTAAIALNCVEVQATPKALGKDLTKEAVSEGDSIPTERTVESLQADGLPTPTEGNSASHLAQILPERGFPELPDFPPAFEVGPIDPNEPPPSFLDPHPNFLRFPTRPEEVDIEGIQPITLNQALELAVRNNLDLRQAELSLEQSLASLRETQADLFPNVNLSSNLTWSDSANARLSIRRQEETLGQRSPTQGDPTSTTWNTELSVNYTVFDFGGRAGRIAAAEAQVRNTELQIEQQLEQVRFQVRNAYYNIQEADMNVRIGQAAVENAEQSLRDAQALEAGGLGTRFDVLRAEVQLANDQQILNEALAEQQVSRRQLARILNVPQSVDLAAADPVNLAGVWELPLDETIILAFRNRAELQQELIDRDIAQEQQRVVRSQGLPQFSLFGSANLVTTSGDGVSGLTEGYSAGAQMQWNLFDGGARAAAIRQLEAQEESASVRFANARNQVRSEVEESYYQLNSRLQNVSRATAALELAEESLELARARFRAGVGTQTDVIAAQNDFTQAQGNRVTAILGYNRSLAQLRRAVSNHPFIDEIQERLR
ncbi:TolC family protein [Phormidium yuhuli AB48]|uniref:TolC family protein n=1 Tax=Phormidium yuhuli AB48 TaxID=2940671 RepID=A0ABY5APQ6_9CYAN|nr:TolC family protein [Phormidium yuhuli]USR91197.1 TolC family protein [Phormidium yuhuli AB48]